MRRLVRKLLAFCFMGMAGLTLALSMQAHASSQGVETTKPIIAYRSAASGNPLFPSWDEACLSVNPGGCTTTVLDPWSSYTQCMSLKWGGFKAGNPGCMYDYRRTYHPSGEVESIPDWWGAGFAKPIVGCASGWAYNSTTKLCQRVRYRDQDCSECVGNPIWSGTGQKTQVEQDLSLGGTASALSVTRQYSSMNIDRQKGTFGTGWFLLPFDRRLIIGSSTNVQALRSGPERVYFTLTSGQWTSPWAKHLQLTQTASGWSLRDQAAATFEDYDLAGRLLAIHYASGMTHTLSYSTAATPSTIAPRPGLLIQIADSRGRALSLSYDEAGNVVQIKDPAGQTYQYVYHPVVGSLSQVTYPDGKTRNYVYEVDKGPGQAYLSTGSATAIQAHGGDLSETDHNMLGGGNISLVEAVRRRLGDFDAYPLTGIVDENGVRFSTYVYGTDGKGLSTEHAGGVGKYIFSYGTGSINNQVTVTDPRGTNHVSAVTTVQGVARLTSRSQAAGAGSPASTMSFTYDAQGNIATRTDFNGAITGYTYDLSRNLETQRTEARGTPSQRIISTQWHPDWKLEVKVAEPNRISTYSYNGQSASGGTVTCAPSAAMIGGKPMPVLCKKTVQATSDATGAQGFAATPVGVVRTWTYTYNDIGQILLSTDPRGNVTSYAYDSEGNLASVTNAAGHVTTLSNYDANGRVGRITDPNGLVTELVYSPRGWLTSRTTGSETTSYEYDAVGQLKKATLPDGSSVSYTYDDAHRLTDIADSLGNSIHYTLDAMGNRTREEVKDLTGTLARTTTRIYDALNRLQQINEGAQ